MSTVDVTMSFKHHYFDILNHMLEQMGPEAGIYLAKLWLDEFIAAGRGQHPHHFNHIPLVMPDKPCSNRIKDQQFMAGKPH